MSEFYIKTVEAGQSLFDFSIQEYGDIDGVFYLVEDNPDVLTGITDDLEAGMELKVRQEPVTVDDKEVMKYMRDRKVNVATGDENSQVFNYLNINGGGHLKINGGKLRIN